MIKKGPYEAFGNELQRIRTEHNDDMKTIANIINVSVPTISQMENGKQKPKMKYIDKIADYYSLSQKKRIKLKILGNIVLLQNIFEDYIDNILLLKFTRK